MQLRAIVPRSPLIDTAKVRSNAQRQLKNDALAVVNRIATYPSQEDTPYVRSGNLGRNWKLEPQNEGEIWIVNRVTTTMVRYRTKTKGIRVRRVSPRAYAKYVQGGKDDQAGFMADKGWERIDDVAEDVFKDRAGVYTELLAGG